MPFLSFRLFCSLFAVPRFGFGIFHPKSTSRKSWPAPCLTAVLRLFRGSLPVRREGRNGNFCMNADLCRSPDTSWSARLAEHQ